MSFSDHRFTLHLPNFRTFATNEIRISKNSEKLISTKTERKKSDSPILFSGNESRIFGSTEKANPVWKNVTKVTTTPMTSSVTSVTSFTNSFLRLRPTPVFGPNSNFCATNFWSRRRLRLWQSYSVFCSNIENVFLKLCSWSFW